MSYKLLGITPLNAGITLESLTVNLILEIMAENGWKACALTEIIHSSLHAF